MDNTEKKKTKFNIVDAIVIVLIICAGIFAYKTFFDGGIIDATEKIPVTVVFYEEECADYVIPNTEIGDSVYDVDNKVNLGSVCAVESDRSQSYVENSDGEVHLAPKEGYSSVYIAMNCTGTINDHGVIVDGVQYVIGHSVVIYAGEGKYYGKIYSIKEGENAPIDKAELPSDEPVA